MKSLINTGALTGTTLDGGKYEVGALLGAGAMGEVYQARHTALGRRVAIKVLHPQIMERDDAVERLRREAQAASRLEHPNSVQVLDFGESGGRFYIVMEFLEGETLEARLKAVGRFGEGGTIEILLQILRALGRAHDLGIVHRDVKPENVMLVPRRTDEGDERDVVKVCDFGVAKLFETEDGQASQLTQDGNVFGTPAFMAPEQGRGKPVDGRTDLYAAGVIAYYMVTGQLPLIGATPVETMLMHVLDPIVPPIDHIPELSTKLNDVIMKSLSKPPEQRYQDARLMRAALRDAAPLELPPPLGAFGRGSCGVGRLRRGHGATTTRGAGAEDGGNRSGGGAVCGTRCRDPGVDGVAAGRRANLQGAGAPSRERKARAASRPRRAGSRGARNSARDARGSGRWDRTPGARVGRCGPRTGIRGARRSAGIITRSVWPRRPDGGAA